MLRLLVVSYFLQGRPRSKKDGRHIAGWACIAQSCSPHLYRSYSESGIGRQFLCGGTLPIEGFAPTREHVLRHMLYNSPSYSISLSSSTMRPTG